MQYKIRIALTLMALAMPVAVSAQTLGRIQSAGGAINLGFVPDLAPFSSESGDKKASGYAVDLCLKVADSLKSRAGLSSLTVNYIPANFQSAYCRKTCATGLTRAFMIFWKASQV